MTDRRSPRAAFGVVIAAALFASSRARSQEGAAPIAAASASATSSAPIASSSASAAASPPIASPSPIPPGSAPISPLAAPSATVAAEAPPSLTATDAAKPVTLDKVPLTYRLEAIEVRGNQRTRDRVVLRYVHFKPGQILDVDDPEIELTRFKLLGTGFFSTVSLSLRKGSRRGSVVLVIDVVERNTIVVNDVWLGLSATADDSGHERPLSAYGGADVAETNLAGTGITLGGAIALAERQLALRSRFLDPAFLGTTWMADATIYYDIAREFYGTRGVLYDNPSSGASSLQDFAIASYHRFGGTVGGGHDLSVTSQLWLDYRLESIDARLPLAGSTLRGTETVPLAYNLFQGRSVLSAIRATYQSDTRDSPFLPTKGHFVQLQADIASPVLGSSYGYERLQVRYATFWPLGRHTIGLSMYGGAIAGDAPIFDRFYIGDFTDLLPDRILDLNTDRRPAPNFLGTAIREVRYGDYAGKVQGEYRVPLYRGQRSVYGIDLFLAGGLYAVAGKKDITDPAPGYSGLARLPIDLTFNLGLRMETNAGGFLFAFSNILGFVPGLRGER